MRQRPTILGLSAAWAIIMACIGCGSEVATFARPVQIVSGTVTVQGKAEPDVVVMMHPISGEAAAPGFVIPHAQTDASGAFKVSTYDTHDGAPIGQYRLAFSWKGPLAGKSEDEQDKLKEKLPAKYLKPDSSQIQVDIKEGENQIGPFDLR